MKRGSSDTAAPTGVPVPGTVGLPPLPGGTAVTGDATAAFASRRAIADVPAAMAGSPPLAGSSGVLTTRNSTRTGKPAMADKVSSINGTNRASTRSRTTAFGTANSMTCVANDNGRMPDSHICHVVSDTWSRNGVAHLVHSASVSSTCSSAHR